MSQLDELRKEFPEFAGMADHEVVTAVSRLLGDDPAAVARELGVQFNEPGFKTGLVSELASYAVGAGQTLEDAGIDFGRDIRQFGEDIQFRNPTTVHSFEDFAENPLQGWREFTGRALGATLPMLVPYLGPASRAAALGTGLAALPAYGDIRARQRMSGEESIPAAAAGALATGAIEQLGGVQRFLRPGATAATGLASTPLRTAAKQGLRVMGEEGLEELAQQPIQQLAGGQDPTAPEQLAETAFGGFAGTVGALPFGGFAGARAGLRHRGFQGFVERNLLNPEAPVDQRLAAVELQQQMMGGGADAQAWAANMRLGIQQDVDRARAAALAKGAPLDLLNAERDLNALEQYAPADIPDPQGSIFDTINRNAGALLGMPHQAPAMAPGTPAEPPINRAASIYAQLALAPIDPNSQEALDLQWATEELRKSMSPGAFAEFQAQVAMERLGAKPKTPKAPEVKVPAAQPAAAPAQPAQQTFGGMFKALGGRVTNVVKALDQAKSPEEAAEIVREWLEKPYIATSTLHALEDLHKRITGETYEQYLRAQEAAEQAAAQAQVQLPAQGTQDARQGVSGQIVRPGDGQAQGARPGTAVQPQSAAGQRPAQQDRPSQGAVSDPARRAQLAKTVVRSLRPEDQEVLGFMQQHGEKAFELLGQKWGITRQAARQRVFGQRTRNGDLVLDPRTGAPKQLGIVDRISNVIAKHGLTIDDLMAGFKPRVYESDEARTGLSPKLNTSKHESDVEQEESNVEQTTGTVASAGGSQSNWRDSNSRGEDWLRENDPEYAKRQAPAEEPEQELIPAAQGEKVDERIAERDAAAEAYNRAQQWWDTERDNSPAIPSFEDLSDRHQEEVIDAVMHDEADGRLQRRIVAEFNEPTYFGKGRALRNEEWNGTGGVFQKAATYLNDNGLADIWFRIKRLIVLNLKGNYGEFSMHADGTYTIRLDEAHLQSAETDPDAAADVMHTLLHEISHAIDMTTDVSMARQPAIKVQLKSKSAPVVPVGVVAKELHALWQRGTALGRLLAYPFDTATYPMSHGAIEVQSEIWAQLQAVWMTPGGRRVVQHEAPLAAQFMREANEYIRQYFEKEARRRRGAEGVAARREVQTDRRGKAVLPKHLRHSAYHGTPHAVHESGGFSLEKIGTGEGAQAYGWKNRGKSIEAFRESLKTMPNKELEDTVEMMKEASDRGDKGAQARWLAAREEQARRRQGQLFRDVQERYGSDDDGTPPTLQNRSISIDAIIAGQNEAITRLGDVWAKVKPTLLTLHQIVDQYGDKMKAMRDYVLSMGKMEQRHQEILNRAHGVILDWQKLGTRERDQLHQVMYRATLRGIHPDEPFGVGPNDHLTDQAEYDSLRAKYDALSDEAKATYKAVRKLLDDNWAARKAAFSRATTNAYQKLIDEAGGDQKRIKELEDERDRLIRDHERTISEIKGPYFPLLRFGDYLMIARSKELEDLQKQLEEASGAERTALQKRVEAMKRDGNHYVVEAYENRYEAEASAAAHTARGMSARAQLAEEHVRGIQPLAAGAIDKISTAISDQFDRETAGKIKRLVTELYISSLPEHAALQRQLKRKGIEGATQDMLRAVAKAVEKDAFHLARLEYADELADKLFQVKQDAKKAGIDYQHVYNNLAARLALDFQWQQTPVQSLLARLSGVWHLGMSPAYLLTNATQPWMITAPVLAGRFGAGRSFAALRSAWVDAANIIRQSKKGGAFADIRFDSVGDAQEREMLERIVQRGQIDITQNVDMGLVADGVDPRFLKLHKVFNWANQHIEASNRITSALAAYRLARQRGMAHDDAAEFAYKVVVDTQLDYSNANAAYWMKSGAVPLGKLIFQFRKYQQGMLYLLARNAQLAFQGDKDAMRALGYLAAMQLAFAGAVGIPVVTAPLAALAMFTSDDDEEGDPETRLRNYLTDLMGAEAARALWKGLPTMMGLDVSQRIGMGDLWKPLPFLRLTGRTGREDVAQLILATLGAPFGMISSMADGSNFFAKGEWARGLEQMLPKMLANPLKASRYVKEGITTRSGSQLIAPEKIDGWDIAFRAAGFTPVVESEHYAARRAKDTVSEALKERRTNALNKYVQARLRGDDTGPALEEINRFNADHPGTRITRADMLEAVQRQRTRVRQLDSAGVQFTSREKPLRDLTRFAG